MDLSLNWIKDYIDAQISAEECVSVLTMGGIGVEAVEETDGDKRLSVEITANRSDCLSHIGIARELSALTGAKLKLKEPKELKKAPGPLAFVLEVLDKTLCPYYVARVIQGVTVKDSPDWMKRRLTTAGVRPINNIVDATNYVMLEIGQPLHAFDYARLSGRKIVVRGARPGEKIVGIDGREYSLQASHLVIADGGHPVALAGVIGGKESEISSSTRDLVLESAQFHPENIRKTSRQLEVSTESSYRFERGVTPEQVEWASRRAAELIIEIGGGRLVQRVSFPSKPIKTESKTVAFRPSRVGRVIGLDIHPPLIRKILQRLQCTVVPARSGRWQVEVPGYRKDIASEIDLIEEIIRVHGYDRIPSDISIPVAVPQQPVSERVEEMTRESLTGMGYQELLTLPFAEPGSDDLFPFWSAGELLALKDPQGKVDRWLRKSVSPSFLAVAAVNESYKEPVPDAFEIASVYYRINQKPQEKTCVCFMSGRGFAALKGVVHRWLQELGVVLEVVMRPKALPFADEGESAVCLLGDNEIGYLALIHGSHRERLGVQSKVWIAELDLDFIQGVANLERKYHDFPRTPSVRRDLALVVDEPVSWEAIHTNVLDTQSSLLQRIQFFDLYRGASLPAGKKSVAFSLWFQASDRTLTGAEVDSEVSKIVTHLQKTLGGVLRGS